MAALTEVEQADKFRQFLQNAGSRLVVVHFWANWAPQCQQMTDVMVELAKDPKNKGVHFMQVEAEKFPEVSQAYEIVAVPTCIFLRNKALVDRVNGAHVPQLVSKVEKLAATSGDAMGPSSSKSAPAETTKEDLETRLKKLVKAAPVMLFMKGTPQEPRCGFSKKTVGILAEQNVAYSSFNILADDEVRQGLKEFSNWPTYPQLYVNGELIGGIDIITEMVESGEFASMVPTKEKLEDRLKKLINQDKVMLFMKGDPSAPRCGFSKTMVGILKDVGAQYGHFDILQDDEVRQGLKTFSNWPTYPQLYVNGDLIGGIDIVKELQESEELESTLKG